jgi:hypothetical protein
VSECELNWTDWVVDHHSMLEDGVWRSLMAYGDPEATEINIGLSLEVRGELA